MMNHGFVETVDCARHLWAGSGERSGGPMRRLRKLAVVSAALPVLALIAGCQTKPHLPPGVTPTVSVGAPLKADVWKQVATDADEDRLERLGLAWSEALDEAKRTNSAEVRREGKLLLPRSSLPRPAPTPGSYNCRLIKLGKATAQGKTYES